MGGSSKPRTPPPSAQEVALADISIDRFENYEDKRYLEGKLLESVKNRVPSVQGRVTVDTQKALQADNAAAVGLAARTGGMGSGASLSAFDPSKIGGSLAEANVAGMEQGTRDYVGKMNAATSAVRDGQDKAFAGLQTAAEIANQNVINQDNFNTKSSINRLGAIENVVAGGISGYNMGQGWAANKQIEEEAKRASKGISLAQPGVNPIRSQNPWQQPLFRST